MLFCILTTYDTFYFIARVLAKRCRLVELIDADVCRSILIDNADYGMWSFRGYGCG